MKDRVKEKVALLPDQPGCYLMKDEKGEVLYVGKAKSLRNRVRSYFTGSHDGKTQLLVSQIADVEVIVTGTPTEALILECNLIKKHRPRYNVLLKDDKSYPYIRLTREKHPRLEVTRKKRRTVPDISAPIPTPGRHSRRKAPRQVVSPAQVQNPAQAGLPLLSSGAMPGPLRV